MNLPPPTDDELNVICSARSSREGCLCGEVHPGGDGITPAVIARMRGYLAANPGHQFAVDDEAGIVAIVIPRASADPGPPEILAWSGDLLELLDSIDAPSAADLS